MLKILSLEYRRQTVVSIVHDVVDLHPFDGSIYMVVSWHGTWGHYLDHMIVSPNVLPLEVWII